MQTLFWKLYFVYAVARAYYVESLQAALRYYYFKDRRILPILMASLPGTTLVLVLVNSLHSLKWLKTLTFLIPIFVLPHVFLVFQANVWQETSRRWTDRLKAWCQEP